MPTIHRDNAERISIADAKVLLIGAMPFEAAIDVYAAIDKHGNIDPNGPLEARGPSPQRIPATFLDQDFSSLCTQVGAVPRMKHRPAVTDYSGAPMHDVIYTISHDELVRIFGLFDVEVTVGKPVSPLKTADSIASQISDVRKVNGDTFDANVVWAALRDMAIDEQYPFRRIDGSDLIWMDANEIEQRLSFRNVRERMTRLKNNAA